MSTPISVERHVALDLIDLPANVRDLDAEHVQALAGSIALRGLIVPLVVRPGADGRFLLVAGFHRHAASASALPTSTSTTGCSGGVRGMVFGIGA